MKVALICLGLGSLAVSSFATAQGLAPKSGTPNQLALEQAHLQTAKELQKIADSLRPSSSMDRLAQRLEDKITKALTTTPHTFSAQELLVQKAEWHLSRKVWQHLKTEFATLEKEFEHWQELAAEQKLDWQESKEEAQATLALWRDSLQLFDLLLSDWGDRLQHSLTTHSDDSLFIQQQVLEQREFIRERRYFAANRAYTEAANICQKTLEPLTREACHQLQTTATLKPEEGFVQLVKDLKTTVTGECSSESTLDICEKISLLLSKSPQSILRLPLTDRLNLETELADAYAVQKKEVL